MGEEEVLHELLGDGARAFLDLAVLDIHECRAGDARGVEAVMAVEAVVFDGDHGLLQGIRDFAERYVVVALHARIDGAADEEKAAQAVAPAHDLRLAAFLNGGRLVGELGQEVAEVLPGARVQHPDAAGQEKGDEEDQHEGEEEAQYAIANPAFLGFSHDVACSSYSYCLATIIALQLIFLKCCKIIHA